MTTPQHNKLYLQGNEISNSDIHFHGHHYYELKFSYLYLTVENIILKKFSIFTISPIRPHPDPGAIL